ncbi:MAG: ABC transporter permease, partial [bacterium]
PSFVPAAHYSSLLERIRNIPGVRAAAVSKQIPVNSATAAYTETVSVPGAAAETGSYRLDVGPGFFEALGIPILRGRDFDFADGNSGTRLAIVSESLAIRLFGSPDAVGRGISVGASQEWQNATVIGVASDANVCNIGIRNSAVVYLPIFQQPSRLYSLMLAVRSHGPPDSIRNEVLGTIDGMGREYPLLVEPLSGLIDRMLVRERLMAALAGFFGAFPLVLACLGLYGMVSYQISRRTAEIGVRLALGASRWSVVAMVVRESVMVVALGVVFGIPLSFAAAYAARSVLFGISPADPRFPALAALALALSATLAALVPAIRAMRVNPAIALRAE